MRAFLSQYSRAFRDRLPHVSFETCGNQVLFCAYAVRIASMIVRTAYKLLCVLYAEICVNATAGMAKNNQVQQKHRNTWRTIVMTRVKLAQVELSFDLENHPYNYKRREKRACVDANSSALYQWVPTLEDEAKLISFLLLIMELGELSVAHWLNCCSYLRHHYGQKCTTVWWPSMRVACASAFQDGENTRDW